MPKEITRHKCNYCKKMYASKYAAINHEKQCFFNPEVKSCVTCGNLTTSANCAITQRLAFSKGHPIRDCKDWGVVEPFEDEEYE